MHKSPRMLLAESIQDIVQNKITTDKQNAALKRVSDLIGPSAIIDILERAISSIPTTKTVAVATVVTNVCSDILNEVIYNTLINDMSSVQVKALNDVLDRQHKFYSLHIAKVAKINRSNVARNIVAALLALDSSKLNGKAASLRRNLGAKNTAAVITASKSIASKMRPVINQVLITFQAKSDSFEFVNVSKDGAKALPSIKGKTCIDLEPNYMSSTPQDIAEHKTPIKLQKDTTALRAVKRVADMPFTMDKEFNNAVMAIIDTKLFESIIIGKSTDTESNEAKIYNTRSSVKNGVRFWEEAGEGTIYFNYVVDFRGRISQLGGISAVGNKVGKAMLRSGVKYPLGPKGYDNLLIALAGAMGHDKETFKVRLDWGKAHADMYADLGGRLLVRPEEAFNQLKKEGADEIFSAAAISLELWRIKHRSCQLMDFESNIFVGYDATSSAVQLVGLIMGNGKLTEASNVRVGAETEDKIHDSYMLIADSMDVAAPKMKNEENQDIIDMWLAFPKKVKRAIAKPLMMTRLYGSKFQTHMIRSKEVAIEKGLIDNNNREQLHRFGYIIATLFNAAFDKEEGFNALRGYEDFVKAIAKAYSKTGKHVCWNVHDTQTEEMQEINAVYVKYSGEQYFFFSDGKKRTGRSYGLDIGNGCVECLDYNEKIELDPNRAGNAIAPNYIHSHDALVLHRLTNSMTCPIRLTHDCFAVTPGMVNEMHDKMVEICADLFGDNRIARLELLQKECFENTGTLVDLPVEYNPKGIPTAEIKAAKYMIS